MNDCLFCKIASGEIKTEAVYRDDRIMAFRDLNPAAPVHILLIPVRHIYSVAEAGTEDEGLLGHLLLKAGELAVAEGLDRSGFRLVINCNEDAGQSVPHLHIHLLGGRSMSWPPG